MDFQSLSRRELQALCKKNKIPANMTNVAMADSLQALDMVEGIDEILNNRSDIESEQSNIETPIAPRTSCRSSARRVPIKDDAVNSLILTRTRRGAKTVVGEAHENGKVDLPETLAGQISRRRAPIAPARPKMETQMEIEMEVEKKEQSIQVEEKKDVLETPMATKAPQLRTTRSSAQCGNHKVETSMSKVYSTRRSTRLLESKMMELSLNSTDEIEPAKLDDDGKEDAPSKVETLPVVSSEEIEEVKEDTQGIKTHNLEHEETQEIKDVASETEIDEVSGQTLNAEAEEGKEVEKVDEIESENSAEEFEETKEDVMKIEDDEGEMAEDDEIESEGLIEKLQENKDDEIETNEGMDVSMDLLDDLFDKSLNLGDEIIEKKDVVVKDYNLCSLRQLKKECKQFAANKGKKKTASKEGEEVVNARPALLDLSENSMVVANNSA